MGWGTRSNYGRKLKAVLCEVVEDIEFVNHKIGMTRRCSEKVDQT